jgi:predicted DCC family thiol-disulfide oxidoreductase YuxK
MRDEEIKKQNIILFDGVCNLCNRSVIFVLQHEKSSDFLFASVQSDAGRQLSNWCRLPSEYMQAVIYIENGNIHAGSTAALKIGQRLKLPWSMLSSWGLLFPGSIREWVYNLIAARRYQWFGKRDVCMVPTRELQARFL